MACSSVGTRACAAATTDERGTDGERGRVRESGGTLCESGGGQRVGCRASGVCSYLVLSCSPTPLRIAPGGEKRPPHVQDEGAPPIRRRRPRKRAPGGALERGPDRTHSPPCAPEPARGRVRRTRVHDMARRLQGGREPADGSSAIEALPHERLARGPLRPLLGRGECAPSHHMRSRRPRRLHAHVRRAGHRQGLARGRRPRWLEATPRPSGYGAGAPRSHARTGLEEAPVVCPSPVEEASSMVMKAAWDEQHTSSTRAAHERRREGDCGWEVRRSGVSGAGGGSMRERAFQSREECGARLRRCTARAMIPERGPRRGVRGVLVHSPSRIKRETNVGLLRT